MANTLPGTPYVESSDLVANYPAVSESLAERVDLVGILPFATSTARGTALPTPTDGQFSYLQDSNTTEFWNGSSWEVTGGKMLQIVRGTDSTKRTTTSTTFVDANISVTITPKKNTSIVLLIWSASAVVDGIGTSEALGNYQITDNSNTAISGAQDIVIGRNNAGVFACPLTLIGYATPATTSAVTYKGRFRRNNANSRVAELLNDANTGQLFAIEVAA